MNNSMDQVTTKVETMVFRDNEPGDTVEYAAIMDPTFKDGYETDCALQEFLSRPVRIATFSWTEGTNLNANVHPWQIYFNDTRIKKKLDNYGLLHCNLKVKIMINASPFYYGHALVSYKPLLTFGGGNIDTVVGLTELVQLSQRPHIWISPQDSKGGEMTLPFFYHKNWLQVGDSDEFQNMGQIRLTSDIVLKNANGVTGDAIDVQVYAWAENVTLAAPTTGLALQSVDTAKPLNHIEIDMDDVAEHEPPTYQCHCDRCDYCLCFSSLVRKVQKVSQRLRRVGQVVDFALQAKDSKQNKSSNNKVSRSKGRGDVTYKSVSNAPKMSVDAMASGSRDEYGSGPVSLVSSAISAATGALENVPIIGPYMTATSFVAKTAANVAAFFGYSNPPVISNVSPFKSVPFHGHACPEISTPVEKLTLDPKNELCIDSRTVGLDGTDELNLKSIVSRESHLHYVPWNQTDATNDLLACYNVSPNLWRQALSSFAVPPMAHVAQAFDYWRGDVIFRFQVVASPYHRGRIRISWDPSADILAEATTESVTFTRTYDIAEDTDFEVRVPYMQAAAWLRTCHLGTCAWENAASDSDVHNGQLSVRVLNGLTAPDASSAISLGVSVRGADNLSFASPKPIHDQAHYFEIQSSDMPRAESHAVADDELDVVHALGEPSDYVDSAYLIHHGEAVKSIRPLLRRYEFTRSARLDNNSTALALQTNYRTGRFPLNSGYDPNGIHRADELIGIGQHLYNYTRNTTFNWFAPCFVGMRGSMNWRYNVESFQALDSLELRRANGKARTNNFAVAGGQLYEYAEAFGNRTDSARLDIINELHTDASGGCLTNQKTQAGLSAQLPMYSRYRMMSADPSNFSLGSTIDDSNLDSMELQVRCKPAAGTNDGNRVKINMYTAVGTDFTFFFYINTPTIHHYATPVASEV